MLACHEGQRHPRATVNDNLLAINIQPRSTNLPTLEFRPAHSCPNALDDQTSFEFADHGDNDDHGAAERQVCIHIFSKADEGDVQTGEFI
jgi:hypothetical protein